MNKRPVLPARCILAIVCMAALLLSGCTQYIGEAAGKADTIVPDDFLESSSFNEPPEQASSERPEPESEPLWLDSSRPSPSSLGAQPGDGYDFVTSSDASALAGSWFDQPQSNIQGGDKVFQIRFDEIPGEILISVGIYATDDGVFYRGPYQIEENGIIRADLSISAMDPPVPNPVFEVTLEAQRPQNSTSPITVTLMASESSDFLANFTELYMAPTKFYKM